jgi:hypothetical protein
MSSSLNKGDMNCFGTREQASADWSRSQHPLERRTLALRDRWHRGVCPQPGAETWLCTSADEPWTGQDEGKFRPRSPAVRSLAAQGDQR